MRRVAILIATLLIFAAVIRAASDAYAHRGHKTRAEPGKGLRMTATDRAGGAASGQRILAVTR